MYIFTYAHSYAHRSAYLFFCGERRSEIAAEGGLTFGEITKKLSAVCAVGRWRDCQRSI